MELFIFLSNITTCSTLFYSFAWPSLSDHAYVCQLQEQERALLLFTSDNVSETKTNGLYFRGGILLRGGGGCFCRLVFFWVCHQICGGASKSSVSIPWQNIRHGHNGWIMYRIDNGRSQKYNLLFRFVKGAMNIIDLLGILPYFMSLLLNLITVSGKDYYQVMAVAMSTSEQWY